MSEQVQRSLVAVTYTIDTTQSGYPVRYVLADEGGIIRSFPGPFADPGEASQVFHIRLVGDQEYEYLDPGVFNSRFAESVLVVSDDPWWFRVRSWWCFAVEVRLLSARAFVAWQRWRLHAWVSEVNERVNPYARIALLREQSARYLELLNQSSCTCGKPLSFHAADGVLPCDRCHHLATVNYPHDCVVYVGEGSYWCARCVVVVAREIGLVPQDESEVDDALVVEYVEGLPLGEFLMWVDDHERAAQSKQVRVRDDAREHAPTCNCPACAGLCQDDYEYLTKTGQYGGEQPEVQS